MKKLVTALGVLFVSIAAAMGLFWIVLDPSEARQKEAAFRALGPKKFEELIEIARAFEEENTGASLFFAPGRPGQPDIPSEFSGFGFESLSLNRGVVEGRIYYLYDSGKFARIDTRSTPMRIELVSGDYGDIVETLYEKTPNKAPQTTPLKRRV